MQMQQVGWYPLLAAWIYTPFLALTCLPGWHDLQAGQTVLTLIYNIVSITHRKKSSHAYNLPFVSRPYSAFHRNHTCYVNKVGKLHTLHFFSELLPCCPPPCLLWSVCEGHAITATKWRTLSEYDILVGRKPSKSPFLLASLQAPSYHLLAW